MPDTLTQQSSNSLRPETRVCLQCGVRRPLDEFRKRGRDSRQRHRECRVCHAENERFRRRARSQRDSEAYLTDRLATLRHKRTLNQRLALVDELNQRLGGPEAVARIFHAQLQRVQAEGRHGSVLRMLDRYLTLATSVVQQPTEAFHNCVNETLGGTLEAIHGTAETP